LKVLKLKHKTYIITGTIAIYAYFLLEGHLKLLYNSFNVIHMKFMQK